MFSEFLKIDNLDDARKELKKLNIEDISISIMAPKAVFRIVKLYGVHPAAANIIKQEMLGSGGDAAIERGCVNMTIDKSDVIIMGTVRQYKMLLSKLKMQKGYFKIDEAINAIENLLGDLLD